MADKLDVVVFGATGYTGKYAVRSIHKMAKSSDKPLSWGIAGRSEEKLKGVLEYCKEKTGWYRLLYDLDKACYLNQRLNLSQPWVKFDRCKNLNFNHVFLKLILMNY